MKKIEHNNFFWLSSTFLDTPQFVFIFSVINTKYYFVWFTQINISKYNSNILWIRLHVVEVKVLSLNETIIFVELQMKANIFFCTNIQDRLWEVQRFKNWVKKSALSEYIRVILFCLDVVYLQTTLNGIRDFI